MCKSHLIKWKAFMRVHLIFIKLSISLSMKGGSGPLVEEIGISINETLFSSF